MLSSRMHKYLALLWGTLAIPTVLWWHDSILWISLVSLYANGVGHWAAFQASRAEESVTDNPENSLSWDQDAPTSSSKPETGLPPTLPLQGPLGAPRNDEMAHRIYYQGIVYRVCNLLELVKENASRVSCGTVDYPTVEVEVELSLALKELVTLRRKLREQ